MAHIDEEALRSSLERMRDSAFEADVVAVLKRTVHSAHRPEAVRSPGRRCLPASQLQQREKPQPVLLEIAPRSNVTTPGQNETAGSHSDHICVIPGYAAVLVVGFEWPAGSVPSRAPAARLGLRSLCHPLCRGSMTGRLSDIADHRRG